MRGTLNDYKCRHLCCICYFVSLSQYMLFRYSPVPFVKLSIIPVLKQRVDMLTQARLIAYPRVQDQA